MGPKRFALVGAAVGTLAAACPSPAAFECIDDGQCGTGTCQTDVGYCSFDDPECPSGQRFGEHAAGGLAGTCVEIELDTGSTSGGTTTMPPPATTGTTADDGETTDGLDDSTTTGPPGCPEGWWDCSWAWRLPLDVTWRGIPLPDFPVRVSLDPSRIDPGLLDPSGADLRLVAEDGTVLPHELEWIDAARGRAELWVRLPELVPGARAWLYVGNPAAADVQDPASVWTGGYAAVWHMGPALDDATGQHPLMDVGTADDEGVIGRARSFDGVASSSVPVTAETFADLFDGGGTVSAWIHPVGWGVGGYGRIVDNSSTTSSTDGWSTAIAGTGRANPGSLRFAMGFSGNRGAWESLPDTLQLATWQHVAITFDTTMPDPEPTMIRDGEVLPFSTPQVPAGDPTLDSGLPATVGALGTGGDRFFDGRIDELRLSSVPRSIEWLAAEAASGRDELLVYGPLEPQPLG